MDSKILELVNKNDNVEVLEKNGDWTKVKYKGIEGFIKTELIDIKKEEKVEEKVEQKQEEKVETKIEEDKNESVQNENSKGKYKVKEETQLKVVPLINSLDIEKINKDTNVEVIGIMNNWANVIVNEKNGWVVAEKLEKVEEETKQVETKKEENISKKMYVDRKSVV